MVLTGAARCCSYHSGLKDIEVAEEDRCPNPQIFITNALPLT